MMDLGTLAFISIGVIVGFIFVLDGWRSSSNDTPFWKSPRIRGFTFLFSVSFLSAIFVISTNQNSERLFIYAISVVASIFVGLTAMCIYSFTVAYGRYRVFKSNSPRKVVIIEALDAVAIALQEGMQNFRQELNKHVEQKLTADCQEQLATLAADKERSEQLLESIIDYTYKFFEEVAKTTQSRKSTDNFKRLLKEALELYLVLFFEQPDQFRTRTLINYRACVYFYDQEKNEFRYFFGASPRGNNHSRKPLPIDNSAAGWALRSPNRPHKYPGDIPEEYFHKRGSPHPYASVVTCALTPIGGRQPNATPILVLNVDCVNDAPTVQKAEYLKARTKEFANLLAYAQLALNITQADIKDWFKDDAARATQIK